MIRHMLNLEAVNTYEGNVVVPSPSNVMCGWSFSCNTILCLPSRHSLKAYCSREGDGAV